MHPNTRLLEISRSGEIRHLKSEQVPEVKLSPWFEASVSFTCGCHIALDARLKTESSHQGSVSCMFGIVELTGVSSALDDW